MKLIDRNIDVLSQNSDHWIRTHSENEFPLKLIRKDEEGNDIIYNNSQTLVLRNVFDKSSQPNYLKRELIFVLGVISAEEIRELVRTMSKESFLIIIEPNNDFFTYALSEKDLSIFESPNVILFADDLNNLSLFLDKIFSTNLLYYLKCIKFYFTYFYRQYNVDKCIEVVKLIKETVKYKTMMYGNSIEDSLTGFRHNMKNIEYLARSKDVSQLKNSFKNVPAIVVAAGPSLNKNIEQLKDIKNNAVIIAVDTIAQRLCDEGIIPDFICSIERDRETYTYFYENKTYPAETTLVAPLVLYPKIFEEFQGDIIIPTRQNVGEFIWLQEIFGISGDNSISIGQSCAHVAFGFAEHIGASPIVLIGQDLAFGSEAEQTHAAGTIYDDEELANKFPIVQEGILVEGYYGIDVQTTNTWNNFRKWFEVEIYKGDLDVINATEGGAKISYTHQLSLKEVSEKYCSEEIKPIKEVLENIAEYPLNEIQMKVVLQEQKDLFSKMKLEFEHQLRVIRSLKIAHKDSEKDLVKTLNKLSNTDPFYEYVIGNLLLRHNLQPILISSFWDLYSLEQVLSFTNLNRNKEIQVEFLTASVYVIGEIVRILEDNLNNKK